MADQKYRDLVRVYPEWDSAMDSLRNIKSSCLKPCAAAFEANMIRISVFAFMPAQITFDRIRDGILSANAYFRTSGKMDRTLRQILLDGVETSEEEKAHVSDQLRDYFQWTPAEINDALWKVGVMTTEKLASIMEPMTQSIQALYCSQVLESWLFFEALASDLWAVGVDNGGSKIATRIRMNQRWEKSEEKVSDLPKTQADAKTHPGSFYCEIGMVGFQKLRSIRDYYEIAFGGQIKDALDKTAGGYIYALSAIRNCIAHSAGKVDSSFLKQTARFPEFRSLPLRSQVSLDGELTAKLRNAALETGAALLTAVDSMLLAGD